MFLRRKTHADHPIETDLPEVMEVQHDRLIEAELELWAAAEQHKTDAAVHVLQAGTGPTEEWFTALDRRIVEIEDGIGIELDRWARFWRRETDAVVRRLAAEGPTEEWFAALDRRIDDTSDDEGAHPAGGADGGLATAVESYLSFVASVDSPSSPPPPPATKAKTGKAPTVAPGPGRRRSASTPTERRSSTDTRPGVTPPGSGRGPRRPRRFFDSSSRLVAGSLGAVVATLFAVLVHFAVGAFAKRPSRTD